MDVKHKIIVTKRDGREEPYDEMKIANVLKAAGLTPEKSQEVAKEITNWVWTNHDGKVTSLRIRDKVIIELQKEDKYAADFYIWYEKHKAHDKV